jgi:hypothetical protein
MTHRKLCFAAAALFVSSFSLPAFADSSNTMPKSENAMDGATASKPPMHKDMMHAMPKAKSKPANSAGAPGAMGSMDAMMSSKPKH